MTPPISITPTGHTLATAVSSRVEVRARQRMAMDAVGLASVDGGRTITTEHVDSHRDFLQVVEIDASSHAAKMVERVSGPQLSALLGPSPAVCVLGLTVPRDRAVPVRVWSSRPDVTWGWQRSRGFRPEGWKSSLVALHKAHWLALDVAARFVGVWREWRKLSASTLTEAV